MAKNLYTLMHKYNKIMAIIGAGHETAIINHIKHFEKNNLKPKPKLTILRPTQ